MKKNSNFFLSVSLLRQLCRYFTFRGLSADEILKEAGIDPSILKLTDAAVEIDLYVKAQDIAAKLLGDEHFGLHMGEYSDMQGWAVLGYIMMNCITLKEALVKAERYVRIVGNTINWKINFDKNSTRISMSVPNDSMEKRRHCIESTIASLLLNTSAMIATEIFPLRIDMATPCVGSEDVYRKAFRCSTRFNQKETFIILPNHLLEKQILHSNPDHLRYFERYAQNLLEERNRDDSFPEKVSEAIAVNLQDGNLSAAETAQRLSVSVRTLQYKLAENGFTFRGLSVIVRERLAKRYLRDAYPVDEISYLLGFSEPSVFRRNFKRWTGMTPGEFKKEMTVIKNF
jgi:AraC-like DNA-binding protein